LIKKTLYFGSPAYLSCKNNQLFIDFKEEQLKINFFVDTEDDKYFARRDSQYRIPIEDIGALVIDHYGISMSHFLLSSLLENNVAVVSCNSSHLPVGLFLSLQGNQVQSEKFRAQIDASLPLKKQLWQQTVQVKILNQAELLKQFGLPAKSLLRLAKKVRSGDSENCEAIAAFQYWKLIFPQNADFYRDRYGPPPNNFLNYGYAILRAIVARSLVASGLLPTLGIHHHNRYNAYALADDVMEPYRPFVDRIVCQLTSHGTQCEELTPTTKRKLLEISSLDISIDGERSPLMVGMQRTTSSLARCFEGTQRKILYPEFL
jgi:CRISPR-associated protein Cas1